MVFYFTSHSVKPPVVMYMGRDKFENEELIKYSWPEDIWFHVDNLSSAHVYLRLPPGMEFTAIDKVLVEECSQLVKANSIQGCKLANVDIVYTPASNLKKTGDMVTGQVSFHNTKLVKKLNIEKKNEVWKRLDKTRQEKETRDFIEERSMRDRDEIEKRKIEAKEKIALEKEEAKRKREQDEAQSFKELFEHTEAMRSNRYDGDVDVNAIEEDFL